MPKEEDVRKYIIEMAKEEDICQAVNMTADIPVLLRRALAEYEKEDLAPINERIFEDVRKYIFEIEKINGRYKWALAQVVKLTGMDPILVHYDD